MPEIMQTVYKTNQQAYRSITRQALMQPGNINGRNNCTLDYGGNAWEFGYNAPPVDLRNTPYDSYYIGSVIYDLKPNTVSEA
jgi:hypothetical protein